MKPALIMLIVCVTTGSAETSSGQTATQRDRSAPGARVYKLEELTWPQIHAFDRQRTLFILPVGMIEQHGPHLPVGADTIGVMYEANGVSTRVSRALPDWNVILMPPLNYGHSGANQLGDMPIHPGTYAIRQSTLRSVVADLGVQIAQNGFKWVLVMNGHGAPTHNIAINEACDFVSEAFGVTMLHLTGLFRADAAIQSRGEKVNADTLLRRGSLLLRHGCSCWCRGNFSILAIRPDLVPPSFKTLPSRAGHSLEELRTIATAPGWQGYLSSPARATAAYGQAVEAWWIDGFTDLILRAVRGENMFVHARVPEALPPVVAPMLEKALATEAAFGVRFENWLSQRSKR